ncbi:MAG: GNAT family N-acetyltransferase [Roseitalea sp.]|jgi:predicted GNAT family N-acyltransferase|nr:GNAT family N-acetyltransferase [Roseitalea sp.]MBO6723095.1 GNAT family N-acetyltransferase [Roseitalea sp.]MBO6742467.1 GNAT family N-acetyltransferase [Roseitalea sp.]
MTADNDWMLRRAQGKDDMAACMAIRHQVFVREQCVEEALERDGRDGDCIHYLAIGVDRPVGTGRVMPLADRYKIQRVAVLPPARGTGVGAALMRFMMADLANEADAAGRMFVLSSQVHALPFYEKLGFSVCSDVYMDAGIPHRDMRAPVVPPAGP